MSSITVRQLFYGIYADAGMLQLEQTGLNENQEEEARQVVNTLLNTWRAVDATIFHRSRTVFPLSGSVGTYTIGPGATFDHAWPEDIAYVGLLIGSGTEENEYKIWPMTDQEYQEWIQKHALADWTERFYYERSYPNGVIHLLYVPSDADNIAVYLDEPLAEIALASGNPPDYASVFVDFPPAYQETIQTNAARVIASRYPGRSKITADTLKRARETRLVVESKNVRPLSRISDFAQQTGRSNIYNGNRWRS